MDLAKGHSKLKRLILNLYAPGDIYFNDLQT